MVNYKFVKKPIVVEAFQLTQERMLDSRDWPEWLMAAWNMDPSSVGAMYMESYTKVGNKNQLLIRTLEGQHEVTWGDWIIQGTEGELYPCKPAIFEVIYKQHKEKGE